MAAPAFVAAAPDTPATGVAEAPAPAPTQVVGSVAGLRQESWSGLLGIVIGSCCLAGIVFIVRRAQRPASVHLVSLLVALDASGEPIRGRLAYLARRAQLDSPEGLRQWLQRSCTLLQDYRGAWTHAGLRGPLRLDSQRGFARLRSELGARDEVHHHTYPGAPSYTVVALLLATRERPPALLAPGAQQLDDFLRVLARLHLQAFDVMCLPGRDRRMTLRELIEHYPELFPLEAALSRASGA